MPTKVALPRLRTNIIDFSKENNTQLDHNLDLSKEIKNVVAIELAKYQR